MEENLKVILWAVRAAFLIAPRKMGKSLLSQLLRVLKMSEKEIKFWNKRIWR